MRTTLDLPSNLLEAARALAESQHKSMGSVISELALQGLKSSQTFRKEKNIPVFQVPEDADPITPQNIKKLLNDEGINE